MGLALYALEDVNDDRPANAGWKLIPNVDIDGDDINDELRWSCPGVGSLVRADPCNSLIKLSASGKTIEFEAWGFFFFRHHSKTFVSAAADETQTKTNIYRVDKAGFKLVCAKLF